LIHSTLSAVVILFPVSEIILAILKRSRGRSVQREDRGAMLLLWSCIAAGIFLAIYIHTLPPGQIPGSPLVRQVAALGLLTGGLTIRWIAILPLGRWFTVDIAIHSDHAVMDRGLYSYMRHPSYTGLLIAFLGLGVYFGSWLSIFIMMIPIVIGLFYRVTKEEKALLDSLGSEYAAYCSRTKRFIPGLL